MHATNEEALASTTGLTYPFPSAPEPGQAVNVAPGVMWLRMPLPLTGLNHINLWALEDGAGWTLTDTGMQTPDTATHWQQAFAGPLDRRPVMRVICTHMHPDHIGMAGWLTRQHDCRLWTTRAYPAYTSDCARGHQACGQRCGVWLGRWPRCYTSSATNGSL